MMTQGDLLILWPLLALPKFPSRARGREFYLSFWDVSIWDNALNYYCSYDDDVDDINIEWGDIKLLNNGGWQTQTEDWFLVWETFIFYQTRPFTANPTRRLNDNFLLLYTHTQWGILRHTITYSIIMLILLLLCLSYYYYYIYMYI
jgi:hypothetical protein